MSESFDKKLMAILKPLQPMTPEFQKQGIIALIAEEVIDVKMISHAGCSVDGSVHSKDCTRESRRIEKQRSILGIKPKQEKAA